MLPEAFFLVNSKYKRFSMDEALRKALAEHGVTDQVHQDDFIKKHVSVSECKMERRYVSGPTTRGCSSKCAVPVIFKYTVVRDGHPNTTAEGTAELRDKLPAFLKEWRNGRQQSDCRSAATAADEQTPGGMSPDRNEPDDAAPATGPGGRGGKRAANTEQNHRGAAVAGRTVKPPAGRAAGIAGSEATHNRGQAAANELRATPAAGGGLVGALVTGPATKRQRVEGVQVVPATSLLAQAAINDTSLLQSPEYLNLMTVLAHNETKDKEIELRRMRVKEKQLELCQMIMSDTGELTLGGLAAHTQQALPPPVAADAQN